MFSEKLVSVKYSCTHGSCLLRLHVLHSKMMYYEMLGIFFGLVKLVN
jgi:hypothetical protein